VVTAPTLVSDTETMSPIESLSSIANRIFDATPPPRGAVLTWLSIAVLLTSCGGQGPSAEPPAASAPQRAERLALPSQSRWGAPFDLGFVPAAAANVPGGTGEGAGRVILWSAENRFTFSAGGNVTWTAMFDPLTNTATAPRSNATNHNMFCPGTTNMPDGRLMVSGGSTEFATSLYNATTDSWSAAPGAAMVRPRAYQANTLLRDGSVFTLGGSWDGGIGGKDGEVWTAASGWRALPGVPVVPFLTADSGGQYRSDNHMWLIPTANGRVLHAGPSRNMNWIDPRGNGTYTPAGRRADDIDAMQGSAVMFEPGRILVTGGAAEYVSTPATSSAFVIDTTRELTTTRVANMAFTRVFHNSVVLPNGQVMVIGGKDRSDAFNDAGARLTPELWDPTTRTFTPLPAMSVPRTYHGVALLLPDARVLSAGSGLCGCAADQPRAQVFTPHYLLNDDGVTLATRPRITAAPSQVEYGAALSVTTDSPISSFVLIRLSSSTHTVNNDQRRIPLTVRSTSGTTYNLDAPTNPGIALPGHYMLFALNAQGVPSLARTVRIGNGTGIGAAPLIAPVADQSTNAGTPVSLTLSASGGSGGTTSFAATGLPPGLTLSPTTGTISGSPTTGGSYLVSASSSNGTATTSTEFLWRITGGGTAPGTNSARFVRLESLTEVNANIWASMAEFYVLGPTYAVLPRTGWVATASSEEITGEDGRAVNAIDGNTASFWHSRWSSTPPAHPHTFTVDLGSVQSIGGFQYLPRQAISPNGTIGQFRFYLSSDGVTWGAPVATGDFTTMGPTTALKEVRLAGGTPTNRPPTIGTPAAQASALGAGVNLPIVASDPDSDPLAFTATGLPPGLAIATSSGVISGTTTAAGTYSTTVSVSDGRGGAASTAAFAWTVSAAAAPTVQPVSAPIAGTGTAVTYTASATGVGLTYAWDFGDGMGTTPFNTSPSITRTFAAAGVYNVTLTVQATGGATTTQRFMQAVAPPSGSGRTSASSTIAFEPRTAAAARIWAVNPDNNSVSVFDASTNARIAEVAVGTNPQSLAVAPNGWVWVVNRDSASISVFQGTTGTPVTLALPSASQPFGIAFAPDGRAYVTLEGTGELLRVNADRTLGSRIAVGANPRHLSVTGDGARVLVSRFITPSLPGEGTATVDVSPSRGAEVVSVLTTGSMSIQGTTILRHSDLADSTTQGRGIPNYLGASAIAPDGGSAWIPSKQDNIRRGALRDGLPLDFQNTVRAVASRISLGATTSVPVEDYPARVDLDNSSVSSAAAFHPSGAYLFVALETSRQVAVVDPFGRRELFRVQVGRAPQGLAVSADGLRLYVSNFMDRTVSVLDLSRLTGFGESALPVVSTAVAVATERLAAPVLQGKRLFYDALDPRLSRDSYMSCATCHRDGAQDGRTWDLTGFGEGLRNTIALRGRGGLAHGALHWTANFDEVQDFEGQIRALAGGTGLIASGTPNPPLGAANAGRSADLDALAAYVASLATFDASPLRNADRSLSTSALEGRALFQTLNCASCHGGSTFGNASATPTLVNIGTLRPSSGQRLGVALIGLEAPTLRDVAATAPYLHDGSAQTVETAILAHTAAAVPNASTIGALSAADLLRLADYVRQIGSEEVSAPGSPPPASGTFRYVRLEQVSEINGGPWATMAEFNLLSPTGTVLPRTGWVVSTTSQEIAGENGRATNAIDGITTTHWHTEWSGATTPAQPHFFTVDLGSPQALGGFRYLPRQVGGTNGTFALYRLYVSTDGINWGTPVASGDFRTMGVTTALKEVRFTTP
jgi:large repetitive protein